MNTRRRLRPLTGGIVAVVALAAGCNSTPSARRVALDVIDTLDVDPQVKACMREKVESYTKDEIEDFAKGAAENPPDAAAREALDQFEADLAECRTSG